MNWKILIVEESEARVCSKHWRHKSMEAAEEKPVQILELFIGIIMYAIAIILQKGGF